MSQEETIVNMGAEPTSVDPVVEAPAPDEDKFTIEGKKFRKWAIDQNTAGELRLFPKWPDTMKRTGKVIKFVNGESREEIIAQMQAAGYHTANLPNF